MLDDECNVPGGSDLGFVNKLHAALLKKNELYDKPKRAKAGNVGEASGIPLVSHGLELDSLSFVVVHYAGPVLYTAHEWLEKNRGKLSADLAFAISQSEVPLLARLFPATKKETSKKAPSVGMAFRRSLKELSTTMMQTHQQYIRCIKPNGIRAPDAPNGQFILRQLRYTGVAAVIQIQRSGYPISLEHLELLRRYRCIAFDQPHLLDRSKPAIESVTVLIRAAPAICHVTADWLGTKDVQIGKTRVYLREAVLRALEVPRREVAEKASIKIQGLRRGYTARRTVRHWKQHRSAAAAVRAALAVKDVVKAGAALDALLHLWEECGLAPSYSPLLPPLHSELGALEMELQALEHGLAAEEAALNELSGALQSASDQGGTKEAYVALKVALQSAQAVEHGLNPKLSKALDEARAVLAEMLAEVACIPVMTRIRLLASSLLLVDPLVHPPSSAVLPTIVPRT